ncbi:MULTISPECIES: cupin [Rhizobium]|uniref:cupin n=1 Tax=Rhizobium TaxID=379 RepID=UPI001959D095|nr:MULTISPECIES: cupin [Rhizobium]MBM7049311.1 cupin [Rhizobium lusitanum]
MNTEEIVFQPSDWVPNNQRFPVLIYKDALPIGASSADFETLFAANGWTGVWKNGVFDYQHYHSGAHEVLGVGRGSATLLAGGPEGQPIEISEGDCLILPAGTGHQNLGCSWDFEVVGAYPEGQHADIQTAAATSEMLAMISSLPVPVTDPILGSSASLVESWR